MSLTRKSKAALADACALFGIADDDRMLRIFENALSAYPDPVLLAAIARCCRELVRRPDNLLAAIIERIEETRTNGWPTPNEAWAAVGTLDENLTLVCVEQAFQALDAVAGTLETDEIGARMAFLESYKRMVSSAKSSGSIPVWQVREGFDKTGRLSAIRMAVHQGRLAEDVGEHLLGAPIPGLRLPDISRLQLEGKQTPEQRAEAESKRKHAESLRSGGVQQVIAALADPNLAEKARQERIKQWGCRPIVKPADAYTPPDREAVAEIRRNR